MQPIILIISASVLLYLCMGIAYTQILNIHWIAYYKAKTKYPALTILATLLWPVIFIILTLWRGCEVIMAGRRNDWK